MIPEFPHHPPKDYSYEYEQFSARLISIWLRCHRHFDYNHGKPTRTIWGFYSPKKKEYYAPINATKCGNKVNIEDTRNYSAMPIRKSVLETCFV
jgi:hypothetical protein